MIWWAAFLIGLTGSLHCAGMCSPVALTIPFDPKDKLFSFATLSLYNLGRTITYVLLGVVVGFFAKGLDLAGLQKYFSILAGVMLLVVFLFSLNVEAYLAGLPIYRKVNKMIGRVLRWTQESGRRRGAVAMRNSLLIGMANGFLPCGLVYLAIAGAMTTGGPREAMGFMAFFGLGTFPMMIFIPFFVKTTGAKLRFQARRFYPLLILILAGLFIWRGMEMGGFFSPVLDASNPGDPSCAPAQ